MHQPTAHAALVGLAILRVDHDHSGRDYLDNLVPLIRSCLAEQGEDIVTLPSVQAGLRDQFGLEIPQVVLRTLLQRMKQNGFLHIEHHTYRINRKTIADPTFKERRERLGDAYAIVVAALRRYARENHAVDWTDDVAESHLLSFLSQHDDGILASTALGITLPSTGKEAQAAYVVGSFVQWAAQQGQSLFESLIAVVEGHLLACAVYLTDVERVEKRLEKTRVFLDTRVILSLLGYLGEAQQEPVAECAALVAKSGGQLCIFPHTIDEVAGVLLACAHRLRQRASATGASDVLEYFIEKGSSPTSVELLASRIDAVVQARGILLIPATSVSRDIGIDESTLETHLATRIRYNHKSRNALLHDLACVMSVAADRAGRSFASLHRVPSLFVTKNSSLASVVRSLHEHDADVGRAPLVITDHMLGSILWMQNPSVAPDLPRARLLADAYAAIRPSEELMQKYLKAIAEERDRGALTPEDYALLRYSTGTRRTLMQLTQGDDEAFSEGTVRGVLDAAIHAVTRADRERIAELEATREREAQTAFSVVADVTKKLGDAEARFVKESEERERERSKRDRLASRIATGIVVLIAIALWSVLIAAQLLDAGWLPEAMKRSAFLSSLPTVAFILTGLLAAPTKARDFVERTAHRRIKNAILSIGE